MTGPVNLSFKDSVLQGIPEELPEAKPYDKSVNHAPKRKDVLTKDEKKLAVRNALRYFNPKYHKELALEFFNELQEFGRIYMYRFRPDYKMYARSLKEYPFNSSKAGAIMLMIQNNLDPEVAQHPHELITYGGNGAVFQNWAQYLLTMQYLATMTDYQTLHIYSGHPMGLFPSSPNAPRVVVTNGLMIPNYSNKENYERLNALGVTQYGQMTAGSYMYIGPQGIVHGTTITLLNAGRKLGRTSKSRKSVLYVSSGLGGMSGAQPKAAGIAGYVSVVAEVNPVAAKKRHKQGWVDELIEDLDQVIDRVSKARDNHEIVSIGYLGNVVDLWERFDEKDIYIDIGSDQTSLHNPFSGGYYPVSLGFEEAQQLMKYDPEEFKAHVQASLRRQVQAINKHTHKGTYFFDYGNAFLLEASRAGADILTMDGREFRYKSYVEDIMGPMCFDYGFGPFRWVCTSGNPKDLDLTDQIAASILEEIKIAAPNFIQQQLQDNIDWINSAGTNNLVVGSQARILYADSEGRIKIGKAFNKAIRENKIGPVVLGRDHHDVSGTDSPFRETSNIYDGSRYTADMAVHNVIGDAFRGATWISLHNGGGVGWGEVINGGFGIFLDGSDEAEKNLEEMLFFDVNNGLARRSWARNEAAVRAAGREMERSRNLKITLPSLVDDKILNNILK